MSENKFNAAFSNYCSIGDEITGEIDGFTITARIVYDEDMGPPWKEHDGHGPVSEWTDRPKRPGERVLSCDRNLYRYYDVAEATKIAKRDGWDAPPYRQGTPGEQASRAVKRDYEYLRAWCNDDWYWCGIVLSVQRGSIMLEADAADAWGIECRIDGGDNSHLTELANELVDEAVGVGTRILDEIIADWRLTKEENNV